MREDQQPQGAGAVDKPAESAAPDEVEATEVDTTETPEVVGDFAVGLKEEPGDTTEGDFAVGLEEPHDMTPGDFAAGQEEEPHGDEPEGSYGDVER